MYGMVNKAIEELVRGAAGDETWERVKARAGIDVEVFISNEPYPDQVTYGLVAAASEVLGRPAEEILSDFGEHWVLHTAQQGYGTLMQAGGRTLREFLLNLPNFHTRITMIMPQLIPPMFECTDVGEHSMLLHYRTSRAGLSAFVIGLVKGLGKRFATEVRVEHVQRRDQGADHDVFQVVWGKSST